MLYHFSALLAVNDKDHKDSLAGDIIAEVARKHGVAISRDDPLLSVIWLNQALLSRYVAETTELASSTLRAETERTVQELNDISLKKQKEFIKAQDELFSNWKAEIQELIDNQNEALRQVILRAVFKLSESSKGGAQVGATKLKLFTSFLLGIFISSLTAYLLR